MLERLCVLTAAAGLALLSGCAADTLPPTPGSASASPSSFSNVEYACDSGADVRVSYLNDEVALVSYRGQTHSMDIASSTDGKRYVGDGMRWSIEGGGKDSRATLSKPIGDNANRARPLESCTQTSS